MINGTEDVFEVNIKDTDVLLGDASVFEGNHKSLKLAGGSTLGLEAFLTIIKDLVFFFIKREDGDESTSEQFINCICKGDGHVV